VGDQQSASGERVRVGERAFNRIFARFLRDIEPGDFTLVMRFNPRGNMGTRYERSWKREQEANL